MSIEAWLAEPDPLEKGAFYSGEIPVAPLAVSLVPAVSTPSAPVLQEVKANEVGPVVPCPAVGSWAYRRACLYEKFRAATTTPISGVEAVQRDLWRMMRLPNFDPWKGADLLMKIEAHAAGLSASPAPSGEGITE